MLSGITLSRPRVLLVDDNKAFLVHEADVLSSQYEIVAAVTSGAAALEAAARLTPDAVILDISMPGMTGLDVAEELKKTESKDESKSDEPRIRPMP